MACPICDRSVPEGARFCPNCGAPQAAAHPVPSGVAADEERRIVTVLFADIVGFTALSEHRDPEQVKRLVDSVFEQLVADVEAHGGSVDKVLGDAIVALFGAPLAHEDDPDRAVRAAISMQQTLRDFRDEHPADQVRMRVGINTGEVLVGTLAGTDYTALGDVVNTAARLQEHAPPGGILVGDATRALCSAAIRFEPFESVRLRGREQHLTVWQAVAVDTAAIMRRWDSDVAFVGRHDELAMLDAVVGTVLSGRSAIVAVTGEAGIGKSRLIAEAVSRVVSGRPNSLLLEGVCAPYGESNVWWPVAGSILTALGLDRNAGPDEARRRIERRLAPFPDVGAGTPGFERTVELVLHLLGQPSALDALGPAATRDAVVRGIVAWLKRRAARGPIVIWIDDLQWAALDLFELLEAVARQLAGLPALIVTSARPDGEPAAEWPPPADPALCLHMALEPLDDDSAAELVRAAAGTEVPEPVVASITERSGGNPLFLVELARMATSGEAVVRGELPGSLRALIAARLDLLPSGQRAILDNAAILGNQGRVSSLRDFADEMRQPFDGDDLRSLDAAGLLIRSAGRWRFRSDVVREVAYQTLTKRVRAQRHAGVARFLAVHAPTVVDRRAHHAATAAEIRNELGPLPGVPDEIGAEAVDLLVAASERWRRQGASRRALRVIERAVGLMPTDDPRYLQLLLDRVDTLVDLRELPRARLLLGELGDLAEEAGDRVVAGEAARCRGTIEQLSGDLVVARRELTDAVAIFRDLGDDARLAEALRVRGFAEVFGGSLADAERFLDEAERRFGELGDERGRAWVQQHRAWVSFLSGDHAESERRLREAIAAFELLEDRAGQSWSSGLLAYVYHFGRRNDEALELAESVLDDARRWGDDWGGSMMLNLQASIRLWRGELEVACRLSERSLAGFRRIDDRFGMIQALGTMNRALVGLGRFADADRSVEEVLALSDAFGEMAYPAIAAAGVAMHRGDGRRATELSAAAIGRLDTTGANVDEGRVVQVFGRLLVGDVDAALAGLLDVDVERSPMALAARATASALVGDADAVRADVARVESMTEVSYWDRAIAAAAGLAAVDGDESDRRRRDVAELVEGLDDVVVAHYLAELLAELGAPAPDGAPRSSIGGWSDLARALARSSVTSSSAG